MRKHFVHLLFPFRDATRNRVSLFLANTRQNGKYMLISVIETSTYLLSAA